MAGILQTKILGFADSGNEMLDRSIRLMREGNLEAAEKIVKYLRKICHDHLNVGKYEDVALHWRKEMDELSFESPHAF